jgi:hypothetical protein
MTWPLGEPSTGKDLDRYTCVGLNADKRIKLARQSVAARRSRGARSLSAGRWDDTSQAQRVSIDEEGGA